MDISKDLFIKCIKTKDASLLKRPYSFNLQRMKTESKKVFTDTAIESIYDWLEEDWLPQIFELSEYCQDHDMVSDGYKCMTTIWNTRRFTSFIDEVYECFTEYTNSHDYLKSEEMAVDGQNYYNLDNNNFIVVNFDDLTSYLPFGDAQDWKYYGLPSGVLDGNYWRVLKKGTGYK